MALSWWLWLRGGGPGFLLPEGGLTVLVALAQGPGVQARGDDVHCTALPPELCSGWGARPLCGRLRPLRDADEPCQCGRLRPRRERPSRCSPVVGR